MNGLSRRTGIKSRRQAARDEFTSDMAAHAAQRAMKRPGSLPARLTSLLSPPSRPTCHFRQRRASSSKKSARARRRRLIWKRRVPGSFTVWKSDSSSSCRAPMTPCWSSARKKLSSIVDWTDRNTCVLFWRRRGGGGFARPSEFAWAFDCGNGSGRVERQFAPHARRWQPLSSSVDSVAARLHYLRMDGRETFQKTPSKRCATRHRRRCAVANSTFRKSNASFRIRRTAESLTRWANALGATPEQLFVNLDPLRQHVGRVGGIALDEAVSSGIIQRGRFDFDDGLWRRPDLGRGGHRMVKSYSLHCN